MFSILEQADRGEADSKGFHLWRGAKIQVDKYLKEFRRMVFQLHCMQVSVCDTSTP